MKIVKFFIWVFICLVGLFIFAFAWEGITYESGERFNIRKGGKLTVRIEEGDKFEIKAAGTSFFRLVSEDELFQLTSNPEERPLGWWQNYYFLSDYVEESQLFDVDDGKGGIEVMIKARDPETIFIFYKQPFWIDLLRTIIAFILMAIGLVGIGSILN